MLDVLNKRVSVCFMQEGRRSERSGRRGRARLGVARRHRPGVCRPYERAELAAGVGQRVHNKLSIPGVDVPACALVVSPLGGSTAGQGTGMFAQDHRTAFARTAAAVRVQCCCQTCTYAPVRLGVRAMRSFQRAPSYLGAW